MTMDAAQIGNLVLQIGDGILLVLKSFLQGAELCLGGLSLLVLQCDDLAAVIADLLLVLVTGSMSWCPELEHCKYTVSTWTK